jgi:channel protein (hemolysin III family)
MNDLLEPLPPYPIPGFSDPFSALSHLAGAAAFLALGVFLVRRGRDRLARAALGVFAFGTVFLLAMSGVFHMLPSGPGREVLRRLDHSAIFVLIASTFTPAHTILFHGLFRWLPVVLIWTAAVSGITLKAVFFEDVPEALGLGLYLGMGWLGLFSGALIVWRYSWRMTLPLLWGALAYTVGAVLEFLRWPVLIPGVVGGHELFHLAVLAGIGFHWHFVWAVSALPCAAPPAPAGGAGEPGAVSETSGCA